MSKLKYLNGSISVLKWAILYPIDVENTIIKKILYFLWSIIFISSIGITAIQCIIQIIITPVDLIEQNTVVMNTVIYLSIFANYAFFYNNSQNLIKLVTNINENFVDKTDNGIEDIKMDFCVKITNNLPVWWTISLIGSTGLNTIIPFFGNDRILPVGGYFPYDHTKTPFYELTYIWQVICQINLGIIYGGSDMIFPCIAAIIGQQFKILASNLKNNIFYALLKCGIPRHVVNDFKNNFDRLEPNETIMSVIKRNQFRKANLIYLKKNIAHHQILLNYCDDLNRIIGFFLFVKIIAAFCNIIFIMFTLITSGAQTEIMSLCFYVFFASTELFVYTYGGQILIEKSEFLWDLYDSPWYLCEVKFQKLMLMVQMKVQRVVYMRAGGYFAMCAPMFITFMKSLMSYIALLRELVVSDKSNS